MNVAASDDLEIVPIPLDSRTRERLVAFARAAGLEPIVAASQLLRDVLADEAFWSAARREEINRKLH